MGSTKIQIGKKMTTCWGCAALAFSVIRLLADEAFMAADYTIYYYDDALFQPIARFTLAMWISCEAFSHTQQIEDWATRNPRVNRTIQIFSAASFEVYLTHQFVQLSVWEFFPHNGVGGMILWILLSIVLTAINTIVLKLICSGIENKIIKTFTKRKKENKND